MAENLESLDTVIDFCKGIVAKEVSVDRFESLDASNLVAPLSNCTS